jgi:hypothetical protein
VKKPEPVSGLVIRYDYLWMGEAKRGRQEGSKDRPCAIVVAHRIDDMGNQAVLLAAITHSPPQNPKAAIEIPPKVKRHLGLDEDRSWIILSELNSARWDDPGIVPVSRARWDYGFLPGKLAQMVVERVREFQQGGKLKITDRD